MKIINREMGGGKTVSLVELMLYPGNEDVIYVAPTVRQAHQLAFLEALKRDPHVSRDRFISAGSLEYVRGRYPEARFVIDEIDGVLEYLVQGKVLAIAGTDEDLKRGQITRMMG